MRGMPMEKLNLSGKLPIVCKKCIVSMICTTPCGKAHDTMSTIALTKGITVGVFFLSLMFSFLLASIFDSPYVIYIEAVITIMSLIIAVVLEIQRRRLSNKFYPLMEGYISRVGF
jgi:hypothetical protein